MLRSMARMICCKKDTVYNDIKKIVEEEKEKDEDPKYNWKNTVPFIPPVTKGVVIKVYDGDTITIATQLPYESDKTVYRFQVRLLGIDSPELKGKNTEEIEAAKISQHALENLILNKEVILKNNQTEKYGRILANVYLQDVCVNEWLLKNYYAVKYNGKTKQIPTSWIKYQNTGSHI